MPDELACKRGLELVRGLPLRRGENREQHATSSRPTQGRGRTAENRRRISGPPDNRSVAEGGPAGNATMSSDDRVEQERLLRSAVLAGDQRAWQAWYDQSYGPLCRYVHWRSGGLEDLAEEVIQETWLVAVRRVRRFDPGRGSFLAWLRGIAANVLRNRLRARARTDRRRNPC